MFKVGCITEIIVTISILVATGTFFYIWRTIKNKRASLTKTLSKQPGEMKMVFLIRTDINMKKGKAAAQCCHACLDAYKQAHRKYPSILRTWESHGQPKVTLKVSSEDEMNELVGRAKDVGLVASIIRDAGRTQLASGTKTVAAIGPGPANMIDIVTGHLKLY